MKTETTEKMRADDPGQLEGKRMHIEIECEGGSVNDYEDYGLEIQPDSQIYIDNLEDEHVPGIDTEISQEEANESGEQQFIPAVVD